ncbi:hypothetical protein RHECNPAF_1340021 [Rhizobium etli CNPAF512]|nr:hypothetical protein RHECNPAF_1340021 [Rhizobium etli CNPAF512]
MAAAQADRSGDILHHHEIAAAHVAPIGLDEERRGAAAGGQADTIGEDAAIAAIGGVPDGVARPLRLREFPVMGRQIAVFVDRRAEGDALVQGKDRLQDRRQQPVGKLGEGGHHLNRIGARYRPVTPVEEGVKADLALGDGPFEGARYLPCHRLRLVDPAAVGGLHTGARRQLDQGFGKTDDAVDPFCRLLQPDIRTGHLARHLAELFDETGALLVDRFGGVGHDGRTVEDAGDDMFHAFEGAAHRLRLVAHAGSAVARIAADRRQPVDLHPQFIQRVLDRAGRLRGLQRKRPNLGGDDGEALAGVTGARCLDRGIQRQQVGLAGNGADLVGDLVDIGQRFRKAGDFGTDDVRGLNHVADLGDGAGQAVGRFLQHLPGVGRRAVGLAQRQGDRAVGFGNRQRGAGDMLEGGGMAARHCRHVLNGAGNVDEIDAERRGLLGKALQDVTQRRAIRAFRLDCRFSGQLVYRLQSMHDRRSSASIGKASINMVNKLQIAPAS